MIPSETHRPLHSSGYLIDTLAFQYQADAIKGPAYHCRMNRGNGELSAFSIPVAFQSMQISECGKGCLETYQWKAGSDGFEEYNRYEYNKLGNNWILLRTTTIMPDGKQKIAKPHGIIALRELYVKEKKSRLRHTSRCPK